MPVVVVRRTQNARPQTHPLQVDDRLREHRKLRRERAVRARRRCPGSAPRRSGRTPNDDAGFHVHASESSVGMRTSAGQRADAKYWMRQGSISQIGMRSAAWIPGLFRRGVGQPPGERPAFVAAIFLVGVVEGLEKRPPGACCTGRSGLGEFRDSRVGARRPPSAERWRRIVDFHARRRWCWRTARAGRAVAGQAVLIFGIHGSDCGTIDALLAE